MKNKEIKDITKELNKLNDYDLTILSTKWLINHKNNIIFSILQNKYNINYDSLNYFINYLFMDKIHISKKCKNIDNILFKFFMKYGIKSMAFISINFYYKLMWHDLNLDKLKNELLIIDML